MRTQIPIAEPAIGMIRIALGLGIVVACFWWPVYYVTCRIPPGTDDRSGIALLAGLPFIYLGLLYAMVGLAGLWKATHQTSGGQKTGWRFSGMLLFAGALLPAVHGLVTAGITGIWIGLCSWF